MPGLSLRQWTARKVTLVVLAWVGVLAMVGTVAAGAIAVFVLPELTSSTAITSQPRPSPAHPVSMIAPLVVRPVVDARTTTPAQCPPASTPSAPPSDPLDTCDVGQGVLYSLGPEALKLGLISAESAQLPGDRSFVIQVSLDSASASAFGDYTATHLGQRVAFIRRGVVVSAPAINQTISSSALQLAGDLSGPEAERIAAMLRDDS